MAGIIITAILNPKCFSTNSKTPKPKPISFISFQSTLPNPKLTFSSETSLAVAERAAVAAAVFSGLSLIPSTGPTMAAQELATIAAEGSDNRGLALLLPIIPAIAWVLFNILQPALNQINRMRNK